jgi:hypothetical protein
MYIRSITNIKQLKKQILLETEKELIEELCKIKDSIKALENRNKKNVLQPYCNFALGYYLTQTTILKQNRATHQQHHQAFKEHAPGSVQEVKKNRIRYQTKNLLLAKSADGCSKFTSKGNVLLGFEHLTHEICRQ